MTSLALRAWILNTEWVSLKRFIDGHGHNNGTLGYEQCVEKGYCFLCVFKCLNKWKRENKNQLTMCFCWCKGQIVSVYFCYIDINRTKKVRKYNMYQISTTRPSWDSITPISVLLIHIYIRSSLYLLSIYTSVCGWDKYSGVFCLFFSVWLLSVLRGHSVYHPHHNGQWPPSSKDFLPQILSITFIFLS